MNQKEKDLQQYYKTFLVSSAKNRKNLMNEVLYNLNKKPKKDNKTNAPKIPDMEANLTDQIDLLYLPHDDGYKYAIVVVDVGSRLTDAEPLKERDSKSVLNALLKIYKRGILKMPKQIQIDAGTEFKKDFHKYFEDKGITIRVAEVGRHRQQGLVESRNKSIARALLTRQVAEELLTGEQSNEWIDYLPDVIKFLNERFKRNYKEDEKHPDYKKIFADVRCSGQSCELLEIGTKVRYQLDEPINHLTEKKLHGTFRTGDIRFSPKVTEVERYQLMPDQPPLYKIKGRTALYTRNQLQVVNKNASLPPPKVQKKFVIEKIINKRKNKNRIEYEVQWKGYPKPTWELRSEIIKDVPNLVKQYEDSLKIKGKGLFDL
jgi:Integrase core domain/Chromo (CHRromatin Organisation MOdifier) domain